MKPTTIAPQQKQKKYFMVDTVSKGGTSTFERVRGTIMCEPCKAATMAKYLGCKLMRHLPAHLRNWKD